MLTAFIIIALILLVDWILFDGNLTAFIWTVILFFFIVTVFYFIGKSFYMFIAQNWA